MRRTKNIVVICVIIVIIATSLIGYLIIESKASDLKGQHIADTAKIKELNEKIESLKKENEILKAGTANCEVWKQVFIQSRINYRKKYYVLVRDSANEEGTSYLLELDLDLYRNTKENEIFFMHLESNLADYKNEKITGTVKAISKEIDKTLTNVCK